MNKQIDPQLQQPVIYNEFRYLYENYIAIAPENITAIYSSDVLFKDPVHEVRGLTLLQNYFTKISGNLISCEFEFIDEMVTAECAHITWNMHFRHPSIAQGKLTTLRGMSFIKYNDKIFYHEDAYDLGAMLYEHLPIIGKLTSWVKHRLSQ